MGSGMVEDRAGCIWLGSGRRTGPGAGGSTAADVRLWSRRSRGGGSLLAVVVVGGGGTAVGKGKNWEGAVRDYALRTQATTVGNTTTARVLDEGNSPSLEKRHECVSNGGRVRPCSDHRAEYLSLQFRAQRPG